MAKDTSPRPPQRREHWVVQQHDDIKVVQANERPDPAVEDGERLKRIYGPYGTASEAQTKADSLERKTLRWLVEQGR